MHEASLAARLLDVASDAAAGQRGVVTSVTVIVGELSGVLPGMLASAFDILKQGTLLERAELRVQTQRAVARCQDCGEAYRAEGFPCACPACGSYAFRLEQGEELFVKELELRAERGEQA